MFFISNRFFFIFRPKQIYIMDGLQLKKDPITAMNNLQKFLEVPFIDYKTKLMFDSRKGFYCSVVKGRKKVNIMLRDGNLNPTNFLNPVSIRFRKHNLNCGFGLLIFTTFVAFKTKFDFHSVSCLFYVKLC